VQNALFSAKFIVESKLIRDNVLYFSSAHTKSYGSTLFPFSMMTKSASKTSTARLPPLPFEDLTFDTLSDRVNDRAIRRISRIVSDLHFDSLREQV
jgi:hypothetical protein